MTERSTTLDAPVTDSPARGNESLLDCYRRVRSLTEALCAPLETEDYVIQSMPDASPIRWHIAHTTWFFETFLLSEHAPGYACFHPDFKYLFNSYYNTVGEQFPRPRRGLLSRPTVRDIWAYRRHVDGQVAEFLERRPDGGSEQACTVLTLGLHHEQQHQELMLTDLKHAFGMNPIAPVYRPRDAASTSEAPRLDWVHFAEGLQSIGHAGDGFCYDNEAPRHRVFVPAFEMASRLVTNAEYLQFIADGGYRRPELWLSEGWNAVQQRCWQAPLYWHRHGDTWRHFTLSGNQPLDPAEPVCHVSFFEADAYARWAGAGLPTEAAWECAARQADASGNFVESGRFHPAATTDAAAGGALQQMFGDSWEWTASPYVAYPGYRPAEGALGEYNGKFMCNQMVLRGGSCATSQTHIRPTYRNFFPPDARWQFSGIRLARVV